jgi:hypothetical protein
MYEGELRGSSRRWCAATHQLRRALAASRAGDRAQASRSLLRALVIHPEGLGSRQFWGCFRRLLRPQADKS